MDNIEENTATLAYLKTKVTPGADIHGMKSLDGSLSWGPLHLSPEDIFGGCAVLRHSFKLNRVKGPHQMSGRCQRCSKRSRSHCVR
jgi:hypothetical protein